MGKEENKEKEIMEFIEMQHASEYQGLDDHISDDFDDWFSSLDEIGWISLMSAWGEHCAEQC